jgi:hypothetical protein
VTQDTKMRGLWGDFFASLVWFGPLDLGFGTRTQRRIDWFGQSGSV